MARKVPKRYTLGEEIFSSVTHGVGGLLSVGGTAVLIVLAAICSDAWSVVGCSIFGASLIILYCMSTLYHAITNPRAKSFFRIMDHNTIFFLIAGTYTPITISILRGAIGWVLFGVVWGAAVIGIVLNSIDLERFRKPSVVCYIAMGWVVIFAIQPLLRVMNAWSLWLLVGDQESEVFPFHLAHFHSCGKRLSLFFNFDRGCEPLTGGGDVPPLFLRREISRCGSFA